MPTLQFMPWCRIDKSYSAGEVTVIPYRCGEAAHGLDETTARQVRDIFESYRDLEGMPVREGTLVRLGDRPLIADLSDDELEVTRECIELACFSGLVKREYFNQLGHYCNTDCFILYGQKFSQEPDFIGVTSRRREGRTWVGRRIAETVFSVPVHVSPIERVSLDAGLLDSIMRFRKEASNEDWSRWQNAVSCFNQANTDNDRIRYQVEWVLLCSAFERMLAAKSDYLDVAERFFNVVVPSTPLLVGSAKRRSARWPQLDKPLRYEWMKEFYRIRGDFAHGRLTTKQPAVWNPLEHVVLATIAFPLLVRCLLQREGKYVLTDEDRTQIDAFESLADEEFLNPPGDRKNSIDSVWSRVREKASSELLKKKVLEELRAKGLLGKEPEK